MMAQIKRRPLVSSIVAAVCGAAIATLVLAPRGVAQDADTVRQLSLFATAFDRITDQYVEEVDEKELIEAAIQGMLQSLDPHSGFFTVSEFEEFTDDLEGTFGGIGIQIQMEDGLVLVIAPIDGTPGAQAGLQPQDLITNIDGEPVRGKTIEGAVALMRGEIGTPVTLTILRRSTSESFEVTVNRGVIPEQSVRSLFVERNIGYLDIAQFTETTTGNLEREIESIKNEAEGPIIGWILDMRGNPGGVFGAAVGVSDTFLEQGEIVSARGRQASLNQSHFATPGDLIDGAPLVVLINAGSASASEIVAGALQDHQRATLIGTRSFGKGSVQSLVGLAERTGMRLTTALYYTPSGRSIQAVGIEPDIRVAFDLAERRDLAGNVIREEYYENEITLEANADGPVEGRVVQAEAALEAARLAAELSTEDNVVDTQLRAAVAFLKDLAGEDYDPTADLQFGLDDPEQPVEDGEETPTETDQ